MTDTFFSMKDICKSYPGVQALRGVDFDLVSGEIHALLGENGAGKSTLMKVAAGITLKDSGEIFFLGKPFDPQNPKEALQAGIGIIHQELNLMPHLTVAQNIFIGREPMKFNGCLLDENKLNDETEKLFMKLNMDIKPTEVVGALSVGKQQMVEIAKAVSHDLKILILDEPTASLTESEIEHLFSIMKELASRGVAMAYISHRMEEIKRIADRITVFRDGEFIATRDAKDFRLDEIIKFMVGRVIYNEPKTKSNVPYNAETVLKVSNLSAGHMVKDVSFDLKKGEILGFAGLMGAGRTETARAIFGADKIRNGLIEINGKSVRMRSPIDAIANGIGYISEDRKRYGLALMLNVSENVLLANYDKFEGRLFLKLKKISKTVADYIGLLRIKTPSAEQQVKNLSGGNQQKVIIAKWLLNNCDILIFDEPTRGIDVGAKSEIYSLMTDLVNGGKSIIMISSDLSEVMRMSDRIVVMCEGRITKKLAIEEASQEVIMKYCTMRN